MTLQTKAIVANNVHNAAAGTLILSVAIVLAGRYCLRLLTQMGGAGSGATIGTNMRLAIQSAGQGFSNAGRLQFPIMNGTSVTFQRHGDIWLDLQHTDVVNLYQVAAEANADYAAELHVLLEQRERGAASVSPLFTGLAV